MNSKILTLIFLIFATIGVKSQSCPNIDFSGQNFQGWNGVMTNYAGTIEQQGTPPFIGGMNVGDRFTLFNQASAIPDPNTCNNVMTSPPNGGWCVKLGNELAGCKQDILEYTVSVTPNNNLLLYRYAIILEDPGGGHTPPNRPRFIVDIIENSTGNLVDAVCGTYEDYSGPFNGLRTCGNIYYRAWTTTGIDLSAYQNLPAPNNEITIRFKTHDCGLCGHFGYAYVTAECTKLELETTYCENSNIATVRAPDGFSYLWDSGEFSQEIEIQNPTIGQQVGVTLTSRQGCISYITTNITSVNITSNFSVPPPICELDSITFVDLSQASDFSNNNIDISEWEWIFDDGDTSNLENPKHLYNSPGIYSVQLNVTADGCTDSKTIPIVINPEPISNFSFDSVCESIDINISNLSSVSPGNMASYNWNFGDNSSSVGFEPNKNYLQPGLYEITLTAESDSGCISQKIDTVEIYQIPTPIATTSQYCFGIPTEFNDFSLPNADSLIFWLWDYGDNSPLSTLQNNNHTYSNPGNYDISLTITNSNNCVNIQNKTISIVDFQIDAVADTVCLDEQTSFTLNTNSNIQQLEWDFGDGNYSALENPSHTFSSAGIYNVMINATNDVGCIDSNELIVLINEKPIVEFNTNKHFGCTPLCINLINYSYSNDSITTYNWEIDNENYFNYEPSICFEDTGYKSLSLNVTTINGCSSSLNKDSLVYVAPFPVASFYLSDSILDFFNTEVELLNTSILYDSIYWKHYNNSIDTLEETNFTFPEAINRSYPVCIFAASNYGCLDSICKDVTVKGNLFYIPNTFTPDGNYINDEFSPVFKGLDPDNYEFYIYDRWGELVFYTEDLSKSWDGTHKGIKVKSDVYVWKIVFNTIGNNKENVEYGHVSVLFDPLFEE